MVLDAGGNIIATHTNNAGAIPSIDVAGTFAATAVADFNAGLGSTIDSVNALTIDADNILFDLLTNANGNLTLTAANDVTGVNAINAALAGSTGLDRTVITAGNDITITGTVQSVDDGVFVNADGDIVRDPTFPDMPTFAEVCEAAASCETSGPAWDAWVAFFTAGFPAQKMVFLPAGAPQAAIDTYTPAFQAITERDDFAEISAARLGVYPQMTGDAAVTAMASATQVPEEAQTYVIEWLADRYGVVLE